VEVGLVGSSATEIYLLRHGETEWNVAERYQGKLDSPLTAKGVGQSEGCARRLPSVGIDVQQLFASPLGRARQTTSIITSIEKLPPTIWDRRLAEVSLGSWDGLTHIDIDAQWPGLLDGATPFDWFFRSPDGESYDAAVDRVTRWLDELRGIVVAVSHGLIGRVIRGAYLGLSREASLCLSVPQDVIWRLADGHVEAIAV
jgi:broad specificity phosphatase PhoE